MTENNGQANGSERLAAPAPTATAGPGTTAARERIRVELNQREGVTKEAPPQAPAVPVIDERLDANDVTIMVTVKVHGRTRVLVNHCEFKTTVYEGLQDQMRGLLHQSIERIMTEARQAVSIKINSAVPMPDISPKERKRAGDEDDFLKEPIPPWPANQPASLPPDFALHVPPELPELDPQR